MGRDSTSRNWHPSDNGVRGSCGNQRGLPSTGSQRQWGQRLLQEPVWTAQHGIPATVGSEAPVGTSVGYTAQGPSDSAITGCRGLRALRSGGGPHSVGQ